MKYSQALSYACQGGSMLRNLSPASAGTMSHKFFIWKLINKYDTTASRVAYKAKESSSTETNLR